MRTSSSPPRILVISAAYHGPGGVATHVRTLTRALLEANHRIHISILTDPVTDPSTDKGDRSPFERKSADKLRVWNENFDALSPGRRSPYEHVLQKALNMCRDKATRPNLIHVHDYDSMIVGTMLKTAFKIPLIATIHRAPTKGKPDKFKESPKDCVMEFMRQNGIIDKIIVPSEASKEVLIEQKFAADDVYVIQHGIDYKRLMSKASKDKILHDLALDDDDVKFVLCPVRADPHKSPDAFVRAVTTINKKFSGKLKFVLTCKPTNDYLYLNNATRDVDFVMKEFNHDEMPTLYRRANVCVIPSIRESFGQTVLEAFAFKVPIVAANAAALPEIINHSENGLIFDVDSHEDLANQVGFLLSSSEECSRLADQGYRDLEERYTAEQMADDYCKFFQEILL